MSKTIGQLQFNHIVIVESLGLKDSKTGTDLHHFISALPRVQQRGIAVSLEQIDSASEFHELMRALIQAARDEGMLPVVHVECHGDEDGLIFSDGSTMMYLRASRLLLQLNRATNLNLIAGFAACFGGYFLREMNLLRRCPVRLIVGPTEEVLAYELGDGFKVFYEAIFDSLSVTVAEKKLGGVKLSKGMWIVQTAEAWYLRVAGTHLMRECSKVALKRRAADVYQRKLRMVGNLAWSERETYAHMTAHTRRVLLEKYFRRFFMVNAIPTNGERFMPAKIALAQLMSKLRRKGTHAV